MRKLREFAPTLFAALLMVAAFSQTARANNMVLRQAWQIQDSNLVKATPQVVSRTGFNTSGWIPTGLPSTVMAAIVRQPTLGFDPFVSENLLRLPGSEKYDYVDNFGLQLTPPTSPFGRAWYYRTEFSRPAGDFVDLQLKGATYGAEIWINGVRAAASTDTIGTYRQPTFNMTPYLKPGVNALAILVGNPQPDDLTANWVDWAPTPQDKNMGLWQDVVLSGHGVVTVRSPMVVTKLSGGAPLKAALTVEAVLTNASAQVVTGVLHATMSARTDLQQTVTLQPYESRAVQFLPAQFAALNITNPDLWWPAQMGTPSLHSLAMSFSVSGSVSDQTTLQYGIREVTSELNSSGARLFRINGKPILIRGGGWSSDLYLRYSHDRAEKELQYVRDLGLNTIRLEGRFEPDDFLQMTDRYGILVMTGWVCCNAWQDNDKWKPDRIAIAQSSLRDQIFAFRSHASTIAFLYGSDQAPSPVIEKLYLETLSTYHWPHPFLASAAATNSLAGSSGFKMNGPYDYVPPSYWTVDKNLEGGAWGFNTETSPGASIPPLESLREFIPADHLWPIDEQWIFHAGEMDFHNLTNFTTGLNKRYGESRSVEEFAEKAQVMGYDNHRAMFEAFNKNKYKPATGIIQWMLNNPWPSLIWHLYDYYLRPAGSYFGAKEANRPVHIQYSYDDATVYLVNQTPAAISGLHADITVFDMKMRSLFSRSLSVKAGADSSIKILDLPPLTPSSKTYFVRLALTGADGAAIDTNFYWLSTQKEIFDWKNSNFFITPLLQDGDLQELNDLPRAQVSVTSNIDSASKRGSITLHNTGSTLAFFVHARAAQGSHELLPVLWQDNYVTLLPGETRTLSVSFPSASVSRRDPIAVSVDGWNL